MSTINIPLDRELAALLQVYGKPAGDTVRELIVLELYRQGRISSGKAGELLDMPRFAFVRYASHLGIPFFDMTEEEWQAEADVARRT
jgi:predicted HTH domain antitoxin